MTSPAPVSLSPLPTRLTQRTYFEAPRVSWSLDSRQLLSVLLIYALLLQFVPRVAIAGAAQPPTVPEKQVVKSTNKLIPNLPGAGAEGFWNSTLLPVSGRAGPAFTGIIGLNSVTMSASSAYVDSFDSLIGYATSHGSQAKLLSNGQIDLKGAKAYGNLVSTQANVILESGSLVTGDVQYATTLTNSGTVQGVIKEQTSPLLTAALPSACGTYRSAPTAVDNWIIGTYTYDQTRGDLTISGGNTATLADGAYCLHNITLSGGSTLRVNGPVAINLTGQLNTSGGSVSNTTYLPANLQISTSYTGNNGVTLSGGSSAYLTVYAPGTSVTLSGGSPLFGALLGKTLTVTGNSVIHYDIRLRDTSPPNITISSPANNATTTATTLAVNGTAFDNSTNDTGVTSVTVNGAAATYDPANGTWSIAGIALALGSNTITAVATDQTGNQSSAAITVTRQPPNQPPTVNAGPDQTVTLPNSASLNGSVSDDGLPAGATLTTTWSKVSGPGNVTFANPNVTFTTASFSTAGTYVLRLTANDSQLSAGDDLTINVNPQNQSPTVSAGLDQTITLPNLVTLNGNVSDDGLPAGSALASSWTKVSGPGTVTFTNPNAAVTNASFSVAGSYTLRLTSSDSQLSSSDDAVITVNPENHAPTIAAGPDQTITLPNAANLNGSVSDDGLPQGSSVSTVWSKVSGPGTVVFANPNVTVTSASFSVAGSYVLRLTSTDSQLSSSDDIQIVVIPENQAPAVYAGGDQTVTSCTANLQGTATDDGLPAGSTLTITWSKVSGPGTVTFSNVSSLNSAAAFSLAGNYVLRLSVSDTLLTSADDMAISVSPLGNVPAHYFDPSAYLSFQDSPFKNLPLSYFYREDFEDHLLNTPGVVANTGGVTSVIFGSGYHDSVDADDGSIDGHGAAGDSYFSYDGNFGIKFTFNASVLGSLPTHAGLVWTDGAGAVYFEAFDRNGVSMGLRGPFNLPDDVYVDTTAEDRFLGAYNPEGISAIRVLNTSGGIEVDHLQYGFGTGNAAPLVNAGPDQTVLLPATTATLNGSVTDDGLPGCSPLSLSWSQVSGPGTVTFTNPNAAVTNATFSAAGAYVLRLTANDSQFNSSDDVAVNITNNQPPMASFVVPESTGTAGAFAIASSGFTGSAFAADQILDDSSFTFWNTQGITNQFAKFQFFDQQNVFIDRVRLQSNQGSIGPSNLKDFDVQISSTTSDDASFVTVLSATMLNNGQLQEFVFPGGPVRARYLKLLLKTNYGSPSNISIATFNPVAVGSADSLLSLPGLANVSRSQSPALPINGSSIYSASYGGGVNNADGLLGYSRGGFVTSGTTNEFAIIRLGGATVHSLKGVRLATWYDSGYGSGTAVKDFEVWVSTTTPDQSSFTRVLTATAALVGNVQTFMFPGGPVPARFVKYVPLNNHGGGININTSAFDVIPEAGARVVARSGEYEYAPLPVEQAFDGDSSTQWLSPNGVATNVWAKVSLADDRIHSVYGFRITPVNDFSNGLRGPKDIEIRVSATTADDSAFTTVYSGTLSGNFNTGPLEIPLSNPVDAKYVQFFWRNGYNSSVIGVRELEVLSAPERGAAVVSYSAGAGNVEAVLDLDPTNQPWTSPLNQNANVSFTLLLPRGDLRTISHVALRPAIASNGNYSAPRDFQLQISTTDDADSSFTTAFAGTLVNSIQLQDFYFNPVAAKYVRLVLLKGPNDFGSFALHNFLIYSSDTIGTTTRFLDGSSDADGQVVSWAWNFGDGTTSSLKNPTHTFPQTGDYTVSLTVTDNGGLSHTYAKLYHVVESINADFAISPTIAHEGGESVRFTDLADLLSISGALRRYDFGDGSPLYTQYARNILHTYQDSGVFHVTLSVGDVLGVSHTVTRDITVLNLPPVVDIDPGKTVFWGESWTSVPRITDQSEIDRASLQGQWNFGDGQSSQCTNCTNANATITHAYAHPGTYHAVLTITDKDGGVGSDSADFIIRKRPTALIFQNPPAQSNGQSLVIHAQLMDTFANQPLIGKPLILTLNGASFNAVTGVNGVAEVSVPLAAGTKIDVITGSFAEDEFYLSGGGVAVPVTAGGAPPAGTLGNQGTNFWLMFPHAYFDGYGLANQRLYISSRVDTSGTVTIPGAGFNFTQNFTVQANTITTVQLPFVQVYESDVIQDKGIHVVSQQPVTVYGLNQRAFTSDAFLGLPVNTLGTDHLVLTYSNMGFSPTSEFGIVASENATTVTITPAVTTGSRIGGFPYNITLNQGQTYLLQNTVPTPTGDLTGSRVSANKPIAVFAGHAAATIPAEAVCCADHLVEQLPATNVWGKRFATIPLATRTKGDFFRFIAAEDATAIYLNGNLTATLNRAQWLERIIKEPTEIIATAPIMVAQYSTSVYYDPPTSGKADPFEMIVPPYSQFLNHYTISTPGTGFQFNYANVVAPTASLGSITLDGNPIPASSFAPIGVSGYSGAQIPIGVGMHNLDGPASFGVFIYGFNQDEGYGFPGGMNMSPVVQSVNIAVRPETLARPINSQACLVATVTNQDQLPLGGRTVGFTVTGANTFNSSATTDAAGQASFCYTGTNLGSDLISAAVGSASGTASVQWQTNVPNQAPVVNAGADQTITLPAPANLQGSATDDGLPGYALSVSWSKVTGPGNVTFANSASVFTTATFTASGVYVLRLTASDTSLSASDDVQFTVNPTPTNDAPTANAGPDLSAAIKGNLIVNPGNDQPLVNGHIPGWVAEQGTTWTQGNSSIAGLPDPHRGNSFFWVGTNGGYAELRQDIDVSPFAASIAAGTQQFELQAYIRQVIECFTPDIPQVVLEYRNTQNNGIIGSLQSYSGYSPSWSLVQGVNTVPIGTGWIRVRLIAQNNCPPTNDAFFDSISLRPVGNTAVKLDGAVTDDGLPYGSSVSANWTKVSGPGAVTFTNANAAGSGASFTTPGTYVLRLTASDGQASTNDDVTITVYPQNQPPVVSGSTNQTITLPATASLNGIVNDDGLPHGSSVSARWKKDQGPGIVTFTNPNAAGTTASFSTPGFYVLMLTADDSEYAASTPFYVSVNPSATNQPPTVTAGPDKTVSLPANTVTLNGAAADDGLPSGSTLVVQWTQVSGPALATFANPNSAVTTAQFSTAGTYVLRLTASDGQLTTSDDVNVNVTAANQAPAVNAGADQTTILSAGAQLNGSVSDDGLPVGSSLTTTWSKVSGPGAVTFMNAHVTVTGASFSATGTYVLRLTASDGQLSASDDITITVNQDVPPPVVQITAPEDGDSVTEPTIVAGSVSGGDWTLEYSLDSTDDQNNRVWTQFASGNGAASGTLGTLDPTMMLNGLYDIRLSATDQYGQTSRTRISVIVERNLKVGNFTVSFTDLSIPVAGVPMEVTRTYDSRDKRVGDFGFGWTLGLRNIRVEKSSVLGLKWYETVSQEVFPNYCLEPVGSHAVTVTFPGGKVFKFQPSVTPHCQRNVPITSANISFTAMPGTVGRLEVIGSSDVQIDGSVPGPVNLIGFGGGVDIFNSFVFKFTAEDGTAYIIDQRTGLQSLADPNGNTLTISAGGIVHSSGKSIVFHRDIAGRIESITDPNGNSMFYQYDPNGDLVSYTDNENNTSTYTYDANHRLLTIHDPRGIQPIRNDYDANGRLISHTDGFGKVITYLHDIPNRTETVTDRLGHPTVFEYDDRGNVLRKTDARGGVTSFTYDANDNVLTETNALGKTTTYTYDANDHRISITDSLGNVTQFTYNVLGKVLTTTDPLRHVTTNTYNSAGNVLTTEDALHNVTTYVYSPFDGQMISMTDALNQTTGYTYTGGYVTKQTDAFGHETIFTYDNNGNRASQTVKRTNAQGQLETITTTFECDKLNRLTKTTFADGAFTQVEYNSIGQQGATIDQLGHRTEFTYDDMGRLTKTTYPDGTFEETTYDAEGRRLTSKDRAGHVTSYTYDELGRLTKTTFADGAFTQTSYDAAGQVLTTTDARGNVTRFFYDDAGRRTKIRNALTQETAFTYDGNGNQLSMTDALNHTTSYEYDLTNRRTKTTYADNTFASDVYDAVGRTLSKTDQAGKTTQFTYDALGRLTKVKDALNQETTYGYNELGQQISQTDANNHTTRFEYDQLGRRVRRILPAGQFETYSYDNGGNLQSKTDFNGKTTTFAYDTMRRLLSKAPDASLGQPTISFTYAATGQRATMNDVSGATLYSYDVRNRLSSKQTPFGTLSYTYNEAGSLLTIRSSNPNGVSVDYNYDALNRLATVKDNQLAALNGGVTNYTYDTVGNLQSYQYPNGVSSSYAYNSLNRLTMMTVGTSVMALASYSYTLGAAGNRTAVTELGGRTVNYAYDDLYRLTSESIANDPHGVNGSAGYSYDPVGNRLNRSSSIAPVPPQSSTYDPNDRLTSDTYDNNGNTTSSSGNAYAYDFENHLTSLNGGSVAYVYDGDGDRAAKTVGGVTTNYLVDTNNPTGYAQVVDELQNGAVVKSFTYGHDLISQRIVGSSLSFYQYDGHGSVRQLTNAGGAITDAYDYDAFGNLIYRSGTTPNDYLYAGEQFDGSLGFYYLRARYMNQSSGRFWTMDSFEGHSTDPSSLHKYLYASGDPINKADPSGEATIADTLITLDLNQVMAAMALLILAAVITKIKVEVTVYELPEPGPAPSPEPDPEPVPKPIPPIPQDDDDNSELFYRAMSDTEYMQVKSNGGRLTLRETGGPGRESFVTQDLNYVATKSIYDPVGYGIMIKWRMQVGTVAALLSRGGIDNSIVENVAGLRYLPHIRAGDPNQVHVKYEFGAITYGLRRNTVGLFNDRIKSFRKTGERGIVFP